MNAIVLAVPYGFESVFNIFQLCDPSVVYKLKNIECSTVTGFSANASCHLKAVNWNKAVAQMDVDLVKPLHNISVQLQLLKRDYSNKFQLFLINVVLNVCDVLSKRNFMPYGLMILKVAKEFSNFNHSCPFFGHLVARDAYLPVTSFPNVFPLGLYKMNITIMENYVRPPSAHVGGIVWFVQAMQPIQTKKNPILTPFVRLGKVQRD
ncbi:uncharacterized protein LOC108029336 [Drosophila biarmipes]|uniref:uncharacterized protein LOC108029336 n=1 Tax=Drosophila biarmipes TaxID=125945 RepID=UPI001CDB16C9|nr:uncharacterized protein LOC108029336 [Drosophila biarmipes]